MLFWCCFLKFAHFWNKRKLENSIWWIILLLLIPQVICLDLRLVEIYQDLHFFWNLTTAAPSIYFFLNFKVMPEVFLLSLMVICKVLALIISPNDTNCKLLQPIFQGIKNLVWRTELWFCPSHWVTCNFFEWVIVGSGNCMYIIQSLKW